MPCRLTHRFAAYCALLAMLCQLLLPFAHAAVMAQETSPAWCGTGAQPAQQWSLDNSTNSPDDQPAKVMFCAVCAAAGAHALVPPTAILVLPAVQWLAVLQLAPYLTEFSYPSFAIPPPPRGPPLIS
ncbi:MULTISPECIES: DUF2946 family protein [Deefgea]|uniref:DUF2946 domain-containing protein n=1 Tax=Deefgea chitinilytica TaxID=570276 RepID=A0ABS2CAW9_9NEIS|nr:MULTISPECIES: DUF2946 family protein [Deefgea]MBM5571291.1 hypothetical protein [Deefgea chitinilytica]MBM9888523.1 hypothetical protein [Deefgea sp. CFH1-16]